MRYKIAFFGMVFCTLFLFLPPSLESGTLTSVFRVTDQPAAIVRGTSGSTLTVNISFGDVEVENWIRELQAPYPLLLVDMDWADRFPETVRQINEKNIPVGLLGNSGTAYEEEPALLADQLKRFETKFGAKPLWFRTMDERFPASLKKQLWEAEVNALGSTFIWSGGKVPPPQEGEIIAVPHHRHERVKLSALDSLSKGRTFRPLEDVLFSTTVKTKKIPE
ncbi:hypothetical protein AB1K83_11075 [Sporosarcina sp. 179-K 3D1 HS]|uniref:hypothetical protein n=1 Tax=Sporosarcina sp. 179-K 3D1 HS TaxID=3232169 RepID=UPI0039A31E52